MLLGITQQKMLGGRIQLLLYQTMAGVVSSLGLPSTTKFDALPPGSNNEAVLFPDTNGSRMLAVNARTYQPALIDAWGNVTFMKPNAN